MLSVDVEKRLGDFAIAFEPVDEIEGFILHEASGGEMVDTAAASTP